MTLKSVLNLVFAIALSSLARAELLFFGGQSELPPTGAFFPHSASGGDPAKVWDDFDVIGAPIVVTALFGDHCYQNGWPEPTRAEIEIRAGVSAGNPGTLLYRDALAPATGALTGRQTGPVSEERRLRAYGLNILLQPGKYWLMVRNASPGNVELFRSGGAGAVGQPTLNGNSFYSWPFHQAFFASTYGINGNQNWDAPYGVEGFAVPEPSTMPAMALGGFTLLRRRFRS